MKRMCESPLFPERLIAETHGAGKRNDPKTGNTKAVVAACVAEASHFGSAPPHVFID